MYLKKNSAIKTISEKENLILDETINSFLEKDLLEKLNLILSQSKQFMRITHQKKLTKEIILNSIKNFPKI